MDSKVFKKEDKFFITYKAGKNEEIVKEIDLGLKDFNEQPENVEVSMGITVCPKQFESLRLDYKCSINHCPGNEFREQAFEMAKYNCLSRLKNDMLELRSSGTIKEHYLIDEGEGI
jgi:hypothetical protein